MLFNEKQKAILQECDEITLDFTSFNAHALSFIEPHCVVVGYGELTDEFLTLCTQREHTFKLEMYHLLPQDFISIGGHLGAFMLSFKNVHGEIEHFKTSQFITFAPLEKLLTCKGIHRADSYNNAEEMLQAILSLCGEQEYTNNIVFSPLFCQYQSRRPMANGEGICHKCVDICPTMGIRSDNKSMLLELSPIDCIACGKCVSVCPSGSVQRNGDGLESFTYKARLYKGYIPLIVSKDEFQTQEFTDTFENLKAKNPLILPFVMQVPDMLNSVYLLTLLQESSAQVLLYTTLGEHVQDDIDSLNEIYEKVFAKRGIIDYKEIDSGLRVLEETHYIYTPRDSENNKDVFSERMRFWVKQESYGKVPIKGFGILGINAEQCTLCLSCVESCNTQALLNNQTRFELLYKPSLCTDCGYCVISCAENVLELENQSLQLNPQSFEYSPIASDEPFKCVECGKVFATSKSVQKVKQMLFHAFSHDPLKLKTLECCADCKVKVMFEGGYS